MTWKIEPLVKNMPVLHNPILIEGLPGIGNVGKVAVDFIVDKIKAKKLFRLSSYTMPHSVFVNEQNLVELPCIEVYCKQFNDKRNDLLLLTGDVQPIDEVSSYEFCDEVLRLAKRFNGKEIITLGGIGLPTAPKKPVVYCTGNSKKLIAKYKKATALNDKLYGVVGPIVGVSGLLLGLASKYDIEAISLLAETYGHPMYLGVKGAREILTVLNKKLGLKIDLNEIEKEIKQLETDSLRKADELTGVSKATALRKLKGKFAKDLEYIG